MRPIATDGVAWSSCLCVLSRTLGGAGARVIDTLALHAPLVVAARGADVGALFGLRVAHLALGDPALHRVAQLLLQNAALRRIRNQIKP